MGGTSSRLQEQESSEQQKELETQAASVAALPLLRSSFSTLSSSQSSLSLSSLIQCFSLQKHPITFDHHDCFPAIVHHIGTAIARTIFFQGSQGRDLHHNDNDDNEKNEQEKVINWAEFVRGFLRACGRMSVSSLLNVLFKVVASAAQTAASPFQLQFNDDDDDGSSKVDGSLSPRELGIVLWLCFVMSADTNQPPTATYQIPDISHLLLSAVLSCGDDTGSGGGGGGEVDVWAVCDVFGRDEPRLPVGKVHTWALRTVPNLAGCFSGFITSRLSSLSADPHPSQESGTGASGTGSEDTSLSDTSKSYLLTQGRAWALSLSQRSSISEEILRICFPCSIDVIEETLLYRSGAHGKGLNRFWSNVEGYHGPVLVLVSATSGESSESSRKWIIGALTHQGFENRDVFYGGGGYLYSISPAFHAFSASGKEQNYVYSHLHPAVRAYDPHPKPVGIAFGGSPGNERIFIDEDFSKVTVRHHAVDKTYQHGPLFPDQGYLPVEASILDVEVWGLGGKAAKAVQLSYKKREELFTEQRRKVDLKTFASWEDSPEKMMMDMMGDPNAVRREDR